MFLPSRDTDGAAISFIEASIHSAAQKSTGIKLSALSPSACAKFDARSEPFINISTPAIGRKIIPKPQLSI